jgi:stage III sporulation protein AG
MLRKTAREKIEKGWKKYKYVGLVILIGVILLAWPSGDKKKSDSPSHTDQSTAQNSTTAGMEERMKKILSKIDGVGNLQLMLTVDSEGKHQLAQNTELSYSGQTTSPDEYSKKTETVVISGDSGDETVVTGNSGPVYRGALVVCQGADNPEVRLAVTNAVAALTGLGSDRITVVRCQ